MENSNFCTLYIVRHGETDWNKRRVVQGHTDIPLNPNGEIQAKDLGLTLKGIFFDAVFSSDLIRAKRTAELITLEKKLAIQTTKLLRERSFGILEGKSVEGLLSQWELMKTLDKAKRANYKINESAESDEELFGRFSTFVREIAAAYVGKTVLVVSHGGVLRSLLFHLGAASYEEDIRIKNTAYIKLRTDGVEFFIEEVHGVVKIEKT